MRFKLRAPLRVPRLTAVIAPSGGDLTFGWTPPYSLPNYPNTSVLIGTNDAGDVKPASHTETNWLYAVFDAFGGGVFVPDYSAGGAYVLVNTGGHLAPANVGACLFDFEDATWKRIDPSNGPTPREADYTVEETTGDPRYEISGFPDVPAPAHTYAIPQYLALGAKGSVLIPMRESMCTTSVQGQGVYRFDMATGAYSRMSEALGAGGAAPPQESQFVHDTSADRWYYIKNGTIHYDQNLTYLRESDYTFATAATYDWPPEVGTGYGRALYHAPGNMLVFHRGTGMVKLDMSDVAAGWSTLNTTGTIPASGATWVWHPTAGKYFLKQSNTGDVLYTLTPPASSPLSNAWTLDSVTIEGDGLPDKNLTTGNTLHHTGLMYVPALDLLAWVSGPGQVALIKV